MKYSIIVPIYNVSLYLDKCLNSILMQTYKNFEVILINDGSTDESEKIIDKYISLDKRFIKINKKNEGVSAARNDGIKLSSGDYLLFIDSDDYIDTDLLKTINDAVTNKKYDIVRFNAVKIENDQKKFENYIELNNLTGEEAFLKLINEPLFTTVWHQAYNAYFFKNNNFKYEEGRVHEDFGVTPLIYLKAKSVVSIDYNGYYYIVRNDSIMTKKDDEYDTIRNNDMIYMFNMLIESTKNIKINEYTLKVFNSFLANSLINRAKDLKGDSLKGYLSELKKYKVGFYLMNDTLGRKLKKMCFKLMPKLYIKFYL